MWRVAIVFVLACAVPAPRVARPTSLVGTTTYVVTDPQRADPIVPAQPRAWTVQLYYPAEPTPITTAYADDPAVLDALVAEHYYGATDAELRAWAHRPAVAAVGARPASGAFPLVTISPGLGFARLNYAELAAHFVARGYVVAVIDHPYIGLQRIAGRWLRADDDPAVQSENPADALPRVRDWAHDISVVVDDLAATRRVPGLAIEMSRVIATGHSIGGTAAVVACADARLAACVDFEGFLEGIDAPAGRPILAAFSRAKGRPPTLAPGQTDPIDAIARALAAGGQPIWTAKVTGGSHTSYSDAPDVLPRTLSRFGGELMTPARSFELYAGLVDAFARAYGRGGGGDAAFRAALAAMPEVAARLTR